MEDLVRKQVNNKQCCVHAILLMQIASFAGKCKCKNTQHILRSVLRNAAHATENAVSFGAGSNPSAADSDATGFPPYSVGPRRSK